MKKTIVKKIIFLLLLIFCFNSVASAADEKITQEETQLPQGLLDFRRFEIITLGAMPFVTLDVTLGYSIYQFADKKIQNPNGNVNFPNPFKSSEAYSIDEMRNIILTSLGICIGIGASDLIFNLIKRNKIKLQNQKKEIEISTIENDPEAIRIEMPNHNIEDSEIIFIEEEL